MKTIIYGAIVFVVVLVLSLFFLTKVVAAPEPIPQPPAHEKDALFNRIAYCESRNNPQAKNSHSTASGRFQFIKKSWKYYGQKYWGDEWVTKDIFDYDTNTELAWYVYNLRGTKDWEESSWCWSKETHEH